MITLFQQRVYEALLKVPRGKVTTYRELARYVGCGSAQAVGQALRHNPFAPNVPCHRVVKSTLQMGGFQGQTQGSSIELKRKLLEKEGILFDDRGRIRCEHVFTF